MVEAGTQVLSSGEALRMNCYASLAAGEMDDYAFARTAYADWCEERGDERRARLSRLKALTMRGPGLLWPRPGLLPDLSPHQVAELRKSLARPLGLLVGTPGTGKTFCTARVVADLVERFGSDAIAVCAPTGKAAVRITELLAEHGVAIRAKTIHSLLEIGRNGHDGKGWGFRRNSVNPLEQRFVIVDEVSMLDTGLADSLLSACKPGTHVLLVGDPNQLPPVGHGAPLRDLIAAGVACGTLTEVRRNAGLIVEACARIKDGRPFEVAPSYADGNLHVMEAKEPERQLALLEDLLTNLNRYAADHFDPVWDVQVIVAVNSSGSLSRDNVNKRLQLLLNAGGVRCEGNPYRLNDKLICLKNGMYMAEPNTMPTSGHSMNSNECWVANGEIGRVVQNGPRFLSALFDGGRCVRIPLGGEGSGSDFDLGYAITCHKSQGSQWPIVVVMLDASNGAARVATREWIYTAVSRAQRRCFLVGRHDVATMMSRRPSLEKRKTFLVEILKGGKANAY